MSPEYAPINSVPFPPVTFGAAGAAANVPIVAMPINTEHATVRIERVEFMRVSRAILDVAKGRDISPSPIQVPVDRDGMRTKGQGGVASAVPHDQQSPA